MSERQSLKPQEQSKLLAVLTDPRDRAMIIMGFCHGFRSSEIAELRLSDLELDNNILRIKRGKGSETTDHEITDVAPYFELRTLRAALDARPESTEDYVFVSRKGGRLSRSQVFRIFQSAAERAGLQRSKRHYHCCKHTGAVDMINAGASLPEVQKRFGWKSLATVGKYLEVSDETAGMAAKRAHAQLAGSML